MSTQVKSCPPDGSLSTYGTPRTAKLFVPSEGGYSSDGSSRKASWWKEEVPGEDVPAGILEDAQVVPDSAKAVGFESAATSASSGSSDAQESGSAWPLGLLVGLVVGAGALAGSRKVLSWGQTQTVPLDSDPEGSEGSSPLAAYQPFLQVASQKYEREIQAAQQTREQDLRQAKQEYQRETERYEARIEKDTLRSQDAARRAQQDAYELSQKPQQLEQNKAKLRDDTEFLRHVQEKLEQAEEELQQMEPLRDEYAALANEWRRWDDLNPHGPECRAIEKQLRRLEDEIWALGDADAEERLELQEEIQSLRESESFLEEEMGELEEAIEDYPEDIEALEDDIEACEDEMADLDADIEEQQANIDDAESEYEESVAEADEQYEENEAEAKRRYEDAVQQANAADAPADTGQGGDTSNTGNDQSTGDNNQQGSDQQDNQSGQNTGSGTRQDSAQPDGNATDPNTPANTVSDSDLKEFQDALNKAQELLAELRGGDTAIGPPPQRTLADWLQDSLSVLSFLMTQQLFPGLSNDANQRIGAFLFPGIADAMNKLQTGFYDVRPSAPGPLYDALPDLGAIFAGVIDLAQAGEHVAVAAAQNIGTLILNGEIGELYNYLNGKH